jgi:hypothetical protein
VEEFLKKALALWGPRQKIRLLRADSGFFDDKLLSFLEQRRLPYIVVARRTKWVKRAAWRVEQWTLRDDNFAFGVLLTSGAGAPEETWHDYNRRADMENRIAELKHELGADGFCLKEFFATEAAFRSVLLSCNLLAEFQGAAGLPACREPATIRRQGLTCGAILGRSGRRLVVHLSHSWGGLKTRILLLENFLHWQIPTSPKLDPMRVT